MYKLYIWYEHVAVSRRHCSAKTSISHPKIYICIRIYEKTKEEKKKKYSIVHYTQIDENNWVYLRWLAFISFNGHIILPNLYFLHGLLSSCWNCSFLVLFHCCLNWWFMARGVFEWALFGVNGGLARDELRAERMIAEPDELILVLSKERVHLIWKGNFFAFNKVI